MIRLVYAAYFLESGLLLVVLPWSSFWDRNAIFEIAPLVHAWLRDPFVRGAVSGLGILTVTLGLVELGSLLWSRLGEGNGADSLPDGLGPRIDSPKGVT